MDNRINWVGKSAKKGVGITDVTSHQLKRLARKSFDTAERLWRAVRKIVQDNQLMACFQQNKRCMAADKPRTTSKQ